MPNGTISKNICTNCILYHNKYLLEYVMQPHHSTSMLAPLPNTSYTVEVSHLGHNCIFSALAIFFFFFFFFYQQWSYVLLDYSFAHNLELFYQVKDNSFCCRAILQQDANYNSLYYDVMAR